MKAWTMNQTKHKNMVQLPAVKDFVQKFRMFVLNVVSFLLLFFFFFGGGVKSASMFLWFFFVLQIFYFTLIPIFVSLYIYILCFMDFILYFFVFFLCMHKFVYFNFGILVFCLFVLIYKNWSFCILASLEFVLWTCLKAFWVLTYSHFWFRGLAGPKLCKFLYSTVL